MLLKISKSLSLALAAIFSIGSVSATIPNGYYDQCENKQGGKNLLTALYQTISKHEVVSYDGLWNVYNTSDVDENGKIWDMYSTKRWDTGKDHCGNYKYVGDCYNREHSFPKSWFKEASPMKSDAFHVYPTDGKVNGQRSNYPYGECDGGTTLPSNGNVKALGKLGKSTFPGYSGTVFEPADEYKGDFARTYFYMAACYNDKIANWNSDMLANNSYPCYKEWAVNLLLKWHREDPVSEKELKRNDAVYAYQNNRNPFIDHPELAEYIWGNKTDERWNSNGGGGEIDPNPNPNPNPDPEPDPIPTPTPDPTVDGDGSFEAPYNCGQVIDGQIKAASAWIYGYVVGAINGNAIEHYTSVTTNFAISDNPDEMDPTATCAIQLPNKSEFQGDLNLKDNKANIGRKIMLKGQLTDYFGRPGMKNVTEFRWIEGNTDKINSVESPSVQVIGGNHTIDIYAPNQTIEITLAGVDGIVWYTGSVTDRHQFDLPRGIYIVRTPDNIFRILVK